MRPSAVVSSLPRSNARVRREGVGESMCWLLRLAGFSAGLLLNYGSIKTKVSGWDFGADWRRAGLTLVNPWQIKVSCAQPQKSQSAEVHLSHTTVPIWLMQLLFCFVKERNIHTGGGIFQRTLCPSSPHRVVSN